MIGRVNYVVFVASEQSILKFWKKFFAEQFFAGLIFADFQKIAKSAKNSTPRKKVVLQYFKKIFLKVIPLCGNVGLKGLDSHFGLKRR